MSEQSAIIRAVCISEKKGEQKHPVASAHLRPEHGIDGDAHAGNWHRQVSLLGQESVDRLQEKIGMPLFPGAFAENILCEGITLYELPVGTRLRIGTALCEVTQIGKECHADCAKQLIRHGALPVFPGGKPLPIPENSDADAGLRTRRADVPLEFPQTLLYNG